MKSLFKKIVCLSLVAVCALALVPTPAQAAEPVSKTLSLPGGAVNTNYWAYSSGENRGAYTAFHLAHAVIRTAQAVDDVATVTISHIRSGSTNSVYTFTVASNGTSAIYYPSNTFYWLRGDVLKASLSATNAATLNITALEQ